MLRSLYIQNYALIEKLDISFEQGFSVITGETGAGKSIILGAIGLLLGQRADVKSIRTGATKCIIEARFDISNYHMQPFFEENELDYEDECILRRELYASGKSRAFINDTPAQLAPELVKKINRMTLDAYKALNCRGVVRIDFIVKGEDPYLIEINSIPGMSAHSIIPQQARQIGMSVSELYDIIIEDTYQCAK